MANIDMTEALDRFDVRPDGILIWKPVTLKYVKDARAQKIWNARYAGKPASTQRKDKRYVVSIRGKKVFAHRIIFALFNGRWPSGEIDHINGDHTDNRPENLREVSKSGNMRNQKRSKANASGVTGVNKLNGQWRAYIQHRGKPKHLGFFGCLTAAIIARKTAELRFGYHPNHGRAA